MKTCTALLFAAGLASTLANPMADIQPLIVGGKEAPTNSSLFTTGLRDTADGASYCGGSLIHPKWVLSAAHCHDGVYVNVGTHFISGSTDGKIVKILRKISHPKFTGVATGWDYALLELEEEVTAFPPVKLAKADGSDEPVGAVATALGWGQLSDLGSKSKVLLQVDLPIVTKDYCQQKLSQWATISDTMLCAGAESNKDTCGGDSGGPLIVKNANGTAVLVGITSWGKSCGVSGRPGVYGRVSAGRAFIDQYVPLTQRA